MTSAPAQPVDATMLVCVSGPDSGKRLILDDEARLIGRGIDCHIISDDSEAGTRHVALLARDGRLAFEALEGADVFVDGERLERGKLRQGQQLRIGRSLWQLADEDVADRYAGWIRAAGGKLTDIAGLERVEGFSVRALFSQVFRKHSQEEIEDYLNVGSPSTTPALSEVNTSWPTPWMFARAAVLSILVYIGFWIALDQFHNLKLLPGLVFVGSFAIPLAVLLFFIEINIVRNVSLWQIIKLFLVGAVLSLGFALVLFSFSAGVSRELAGYAAMLAGPVEETAKLLVMIFFASQLRYRWTLNGLLIGATVGCGFAAFESAGYAFYFGMNTYNVSFLSNLADLLNSGRPMQDAQILAAFIAEKDMISEIIGITNLRGLLSITGSHMVYSGLVGAALWRVRGSRRFRFEMLTDWKFLRVFIIAVVLHSLWNSPWFYQLGVYVRAIPFGLAGWFLVMSFVNEGLNEVREAKKELHEASATIVNTIFSGGTPGNDGSRDDDGW